MFHKKKEAKTESLNYKQENNQNILLRYNNKKNDTFYLFIKTMNSIDNFFLYLYKHISFYIKTMINKKAFNLNKYFFISFLLTLLFSVALNQNISRDLLINAYFNDSQITHVSYDKIIKGKYNSEINNPNINDKYSYNSNNDNNNCQTCYNYHEEQNRDFCHDPKCRNHNNKSNKEDGNDNQQEKEFYILNIFPMKAFFITCLSFFSLYIIIKTTYYSRINNSIFINMIGVYTSYKILSYLYITEYYLASWIIFILFFYFFKCSIDSIYLILKFKRSDFEIFSIHLSAANSRQFILKFIILFTGTLLSGLLSGFFFQYIFNYIAFYICLFTLIIFLCNCVENVFLEEHKYSKNVFIFFFGLINFIINKLLKKKYYGNKEQVEESTYNFDKINLYYLIDYLLIPTNNSTTNTFYIVSDVFTLICFDYIDDYIEYKYKNFLDKTKKNKKIYSKQDIIFHCLFLLSIGLSLSGIFIKEYICFLLSLNISQKFNNYFPTIFNHNLSRILNHIILLIYIITQYEISTTGDEYLISLILNTRLSKDIIQVILKIFGISILLYDLIYSNYIYYYSNNSHKIFYHYYNGFEVRNNNNDNDKNEDDYNINDNVSLNSEDNDNLMDDDEENDIIRDNLYKIASKKYKIKIINTAYDDNNNIIFYLTNEIILCYIDTCIIVIFIIKYEQNILAKMLYGIIIVFLNSRKYFILNEIKNNGQYYFYYLLSFFFSIRLIILTNNNSIILIYLININIYFLLIYYCFYNKRNLFLSIILLIHLTVAYTNLKSNFILFDIISVLIFLIMKKFKSKKKYKVNKYEDEKSNLSLIFLLSLLALFSIQLYGINKMFCLLQEILNKIKNILNDISMITYGGKKDDKKRQPIEYYILTDFIDWLEEKK